MSVQNSMHRIAFISAMSGASWGGSEVLWSEAARRLSSAGHSVLVSVHGWHVTPEPVNALREFGIQVHERKCQVDSRFRRIFRRLKLAKRRSSEQQGYWEQVLDFRPDFVCVCHGGFSDGWEWMQKCLNDSVPYGSIAQAVGEGMWPDDALAECLTGVYSKAKGCWFVSRGNVRLFEVFTGRAWPEAEVLRNPFQVPFNSPPDWPNEDGVFRLACVGRYEPRAKGQDLILQVLAMPNWKNRPVALSLYGSGPCEHSLRRLTETLGIAEKVHFAGHSSDVRGIWKTNHALVLPSRFEGLPLAIVEAMLCNRICITTNVAGNAELIDDGRSGFIASAPNVAAMEEAMERAWAQRYSWKSMGEAAGVAVRTLVPEDPAAVFAQKILSVL
jgi:glycosyltransferase involved in cell wall biosynthesis